MQQNQKTKLLTFKIIFMKQKTMIFLLFFILSQHVFAQCWREVAAGDYHTLAIRSDGTLWAWGRNDYGQLGDGTIVNKSIPTQLGIDTNWVTIDAFGYNSMALKTDGSLWAWGWNYNGQNGNGNFGNGAQDLVPTRVGLDNDWIKIAVGGFGIKSNGTLWGWNVNQDNRLGTDDNLPHYTPFQIGSDTDWVDITNGGNQTLAIKTNHTLWGWGLNKLGSLAIGPADDTVFITVPTQTGNNTADWLKVVAGGCCSAKMIKTDGSLWAMGAIQNLGTGSSYLLNTPNHVGIDTNWKTVVTTNHSGAIKNNGTLWTWGNNTVGQMGDGTLISKNVPTQIASSIVWQKVEVGIGHTIGLDSNGTLYSWGWNNYGQLGDGTFIDKNVPTQIGNSCPLSNVGFNAFEKLQVYPNPTENNAIVSYNLTTSTNVEVRVTNSIGQLILSKKSEGSIGENQTQINLDTYSAGLYLITLKTATKSVTVKLIKN